MVKQEYEELKKRFKQLPSYELMNQEFEISTIESTKFLLRSIKKRISERLDEAGLMLTEILQPNAESLAAMYEWRTFKNEDRTQLYAIYKQIQFHVRTLHEAELIQTQENDAKIIGSISLEWVKIRESLIPYMERLCDVWTKDTEYKEVLNYLG